MGERIVKLDIEIDERAYGARKAKEAVELLEMNLPRKKFVEFAKLWRKAGIRTFTIKLEEKTGVKMK